MFHESGNMPSVLAAFRSFNIFIAISNSLSEEGLEWDLLDFFLSEVTKVLVDFGAEFSIY